MSSFCMTVTTSNCKFCLCGRKYVLPLLSLPPPYRSTNASDVVCSRSPGPIEAIQTSPNYQPRLVDVLVVATLRSERKEGKGEHFARKRRKKYSEQLSSQYTVPAQLVMSSIFLLSLIVLPLRARACTPDDFPIPTTCGRQTSNRMHPWVVTIEVEAIADVRSPEDILPCPNLDHTAHTSPIPNSNATTAPSDFFFGHLSRMAVTHRISSSCSGVLVTSRHVLTAAHCLFSSHYKPTYHVFHRSGTTQAYAKPAKRNILAVETTLWHPHCKFYGTTKAINDLALLVLEEPADSAAHKGAYSPICLPWPDLNIAGVVTWMMHSGAAIHPTVSPEASREPKQEPVQLIDCSILSGDPHHALGKEVCAVTGSTVEQVGDPGGPLMVETPEGWVVIGVLSWTNSTKKHSSTAVFTNIKALMPWILETIFETF